MTTRVRGYLATISAAGTPSLASISSAMITTASGWKLWGLDVYRHAVSLLRVPGYVIPVASTSLSSSSWAIPRAFEFPKTTTFFIGGSSGCRVLSVGWGFWSVTEGSSGTVRLFNNSSRRSSRRQPSLLEPSRSGPQLQKLSDSTLCIRCLPSDAFKRVTKRSEPAALSLRSDNISSTF